MDRRSPPRDDVGAAISVGQPGFAKSQTSPDFRSFPDSSSAVRKRTGKSISARSCVGTTLVRWSTCRTVRPRILRSSRRLQLSTYQISRASRSSKSKRMAPVHSRPASDAGSHVLSPSLLGSVPIEVLGEERARANQTHVPPQYVPQLGKLVDAGRIARKRPSRVTRSRSVAYQVCPGPGGLIVRNLSIVKGLPARPGRSCRNRIGGPCVTRIVSTDDLLISHNLWAR